eukprot:TRINITY_DN6608_c0_g1_i4.p1 TRINITY_DN6608_c0_g1~~TRINITY_DN6608_c0_g1_i4.p1  ORF type:complete len:345 (-),score=79.08 TRINITY_DN6608_c0_g1_i4:86-1120(-)
MKRSLCVALVLLFAFVFCIESSTAAGDYSSLTRGEHRALFEEWMVTFDKSYESNQEKEFRFERFLESLQRIAALNSQRTSDTDAFFGLTKFSDLSVEEFRDRYLMRVQDDGILVPKEELLQPLPVDLPQTFNWNDKNALTPIKDQQQCGSCYAFSGTEAIESTNILNANGSSTTTIAAPQQLIDCDTEDGGCNGGWPWDAFDYVHTCGGMDSESSYPYHAAPTGTCSFSSNNVVATVSSWQYASQGDENLLLQNLVSWGPLSICLDALSGWQDYNGGVLTAAQCNFNGTFDHCVQLAGYDQSGSTPYWIVRNSWGTSWGYQGFIYIEMFKDACGLADKSSWPMP